MINPKHKSLRLVSEPAGADMPSEDRDTGDTHHLHMSPSWDTWHTHTYMPLCPLSLALLSFLTSCQGHWFKNTHTHTNMDTYCTHSIQDRAICYLTTARQEKMTACTPFHENFCCRRETEMASAISLGRPLLTERRWFLPTSCSPN